MKKFIIGMLASFTMFLSMADVHAKEIVADQLELCGASVRTAPWCDEALEGDTRQLQALQIVSISLTPKTGETWRELHLEKKRGITFTEVNDKGERVKTGRPVVPAVARVIAIPPSGNMEEAMLFQGLVSPDMSSVNVFLPADVNFIGWSIYVPSSEGKHALTLHGELVKLGGRHRDDGNLSPDITRLSESRIISTTLVTRGDGSGTIEALEATFVVHKLVHDRDGSFRVYSALPGTLAPISEDGTSVVGMYTNCRTAGQRLLERGNLRVDTAALAGAAATGGLTLVPQALQNVLALFRTSCR